MQELPLLPLFNKLLFLKAKHEKSVSWLFAAYTSSVSVTRRLNWIKSFCVLQICSDL